MPYIIDGYNLLRAVQSREQFAMLTDVQMCRIIADFLRCVRDRGHIVFDGIGPPDKRELGGIHGIEVYFSGEHIEADDVIEQKIQDNSAPRSLVVVSSDNRIRAAAAKRKATTIRADAFWDYLCDQLEKQANRPAPEPSEKRTGITDSETDAWLDTFGFGE